MAMQGVTVLVAVVASDQLNWVYWEVFECMIEDGHLNECLVVLKLLENEGEGEEEEGRLMEKKNCIRADDALVNCGFVGDKWKGNACK